MVDHSAWRIDLARGYIAPYAERAPDRRPRRLGRAGRRRPLVGHRHARLLGRDRPRLARDAARGGERRAVHVGRALPRQRLPRAVPLRHGEGRRRARAARLARRADRRRHVGREHGHDEPRRPPRRPGVDRPLRRGALRADPRARARLPRGAAPLDGRGAPEVHAELDLRRDGPRPRRPGRLLRVRARDDAQRRRRARRAEPRLRRARQAQARRRSRLPHGADATGRGATARRAARSPTRAGEGRARRSRRATLELVEQHLPDVDTTRARELWSLQAEPSD